MKNTDFPFLFSSHFIFLFILQKKSKNTSNDKNDKNSTKKYIIHITIYFTHNIDLFVSNVYYINGKGNIK